MNLNELYEKVMDKNPKVEGNILFEQVIKIEDIDEEMKVKQILMECYNKIIHIITKYLDMDEDKVKIIALWIIGTYFHRQFVTYPYLFINATRGSGKTRLLNLIANLSKDGSIQNSMTEAVLFRTKGTLCIDEFERGVGRKGTENLLELLNSAYKRGVKVRRMRKVKTQEGEKQEVEEFDVFRPIAMANINGIDNVLGDRCVKINIEKSFNSKKVRLVERFNEKEIQEVRSFLQSLCSFSVVIGVVSQRDFTVFPLSVVSVEKVYMSWENKVLFGDRTTLTTLSPKTTQNTLTTLKYLDSKLEAINLSGISGRDLELTFPLLIVNIWMEDDDLTEGSIFKQNLETFKRIYEEKQEEEFVENYDISLLDMISQEPETTYFILVQEITDRFKSFLGVNEEWLNAKWMGRALKRLNLIKQKRRMGKGISVVLNYSKAQERIKQFK